MTEVKRIKQHFVLNLWEPAAPAFCSFAKPYVGNRHDLLKVAVNMKNADPQSETAKAIQEFSSDSFFRLGTPLFYFLFLLSNMWKLSNKILYGLQNLNQSQF